MMRPSKRPSRRSAIPHRSRSRRAITLIEMLTVIVIISLLIAIILPALNAARESSRQAACASNLRQIGLSLQSRAQADRGMLCSGAVDWQRDGSVTSIGWVADLVNSGTPVGKLLCPSNPAVLTEAYNDLLNLDVTSWQPENPTNPTTWTCGVNHKGKAPETLPDGSQKRDPCEEIISTQPAPGDARDTLVLERIYKEHYNTNLTASWFLVRSGVKLDATGNLAGLGGGCENSPLARAAQLEHVVGRIGGQLLHPADRRWAGRRPIGAPLRQVQRRGAAGPRLHPRTGHEPADAIPIRSPRYPARGGERLVGRVERHAAGLFRLRAGPPRVGQHLDGRRERAIVQGRQRRRPAQQWVYRRFGQRLCRLVGRAAANRVLESLRIAATLSTRTDDPCREAA